jgi:phosphoesterase RecJ-like protein
LVIILTFGFDLSFELCHLKFIIFMTDIIKKAAPKILAAIQASKSILLHCHPSPDPDSVGSALAMKFALESLGKKVTVIRGDSEIPQAFMHFPGADSIVSKNFFEMDLKEFDLFIIQDSSSLDRVSNLKEMQIPSSLPTIVIDHHISNTSFGTILNLVDSSYPATALILFDLFKIWKIKITPEIAANLFIGAYTDTGGFKYGGVTSLVLAAASELAEAYPLFPELISKMENSRKPEEIISLGLILSNIKTFLEGRLAIASVSSAELIKHNLNTSDLSTSWASSILRSVIGWDIDVCCVEVSKGTVKASFRTRDSEKFDLSKLAQALGGGGHKAAAGATLTMPLDKAIEKIVQTAKEIYNL